jgi:hypothetical protein
MLCDLLTGERRAKATLDLVGLDSKSGHGQERRAREGEGKKPESLLAWCNKFMVCAAGASDRRRRHLPTYRLPRSRARSRRSPSGRCRFLAMSPKWLFVLARTV